MENDQNEARQGERKRRTVYLVVGGALSLLLPLLGALYLKLSETPLPPGGVDASAVFARREGPAPRVQPASTPAAPKGSAPASPAPGSDSGLSMVRGGQDYYQEPQPPAAAPAPAKAAPAPAPAPKPIPQPKPAPAPAPSFSFAKLKPTSGIEVKSWFSGSKAQPPAAPAQMPAAAGQAAPDINALLKSLPQAAGQAPGQQ